MNRKHLVKKAQSVYYANETMTVEGEQPGGEQQKVLGLIVDGGTEENIINNEYPGRLLNLRDMGCEVILETANGIAIVDQLVDVICGGLFLKDCIYAPMASSCLLSVSIFRPISADPISADPVSADPKFGSEIYSHGPMDKVAI